MKFWKRKLAALALSAALLAGSVVTASAYSFSGVHNWFKPSLNEMLKKQKEQGGFTSDLVEAGDLTFHDIVIVASMVQKEAGAVLESYDISSVIYNRLYRWELPYLNIDATIVYALGGKTDPLTYEDLQIDSPYNTYTHMGLTPGAISNPGLTSLNAALDPNDTDYFYYALNPNTGEHKFSKTYKEHLKFLDSLG